MVNRILVIFFIFILFSYSSNAAFHEVFENDKDSQKLALKILSDKYHALAKWFGYQRKKEEWIPFDDGLAHKALDMAFAYSDWLNELKSANPDTARIEYLKERVRKAREGDFLPSNYKKLPIIEVWEKNGPSKSYKVLKAYAKATRPTLPWPGNIYDHNILKTLYGCKAAKYLLLSTLPDKDDTFILQCLDKVKKYESLANEEHSKVAKIKPSPEFHRKKEVSQLQTETVVVSKAPLTVPEGPAQLIATNLRKSGEYDSGWVLVLDDDKHPPAEQVKPPKKRVPRERSVNTFRSKGDDSATLREIVDAIQYVKPHLTQEQQNSINYLTNECGMTEAEAYSTFFLN